MIPKAFAVALLVGGSLTAAAGGAYVAVRQNTAEPPPVSAGTPAAAPVESSEDAAPVSETEALVNSPLNGDNAPVKEPEPPAVVPPAPAPPARPEVRPRREPGRNARTEAPAAAPGTRREAAAVLTEAETAADSAAAPWSSAVTESARIYEPPPAPPEPQFTEVVIPASAVIGLQVETPLTTERNRVEDRVDARVTRDVLADGRVAIPAGSRVIGTVTLVERGGKMKERAQLGVRFHTVVLAGGLHVPLRTETILREGESPSGESARKIGGAAAGGAILGAILGGGKGAVVGGATGAGAGTAVVMAGDRNHATLPAGTTVTARLASPVVLELER
ncbi:MAG: TrbI/VirB10 family protein [Acidobacteria bacterium]|nr:TrbI/VirB10 family protein [Acidobacteriota bacterium]